MLKFPQKKFKWSGRAQSGFYFDFIIKKFGEVFLRNVFVFSALFLGEKYMIEFLTKKTIDAFIFNTNKFIGWTTFNLMLFFWITIVFVLYILVLVNLILLFVF
jgi:hypothetical protein